MMILNKRPPNMEVARKTLATRLYPFEVKPVHEVLSCGLTPSRIRYNPNPRVPASTNISPVNYLNGLTRHNNCRIVPMYHMTPVTGNVIPMSPSPPHRRIVVPIPRIGLAPITEDGG